jgi:hypothetical protein
VVLNTIGDSRSDLTSSNTERDVEDNKDNEEDTENGKLSIDDKPDWVMG